MRRLGLSIMLYFRSEVDGFVMVFLCFVCFIGLVCMLLDVVGSFAF